MTYMDLQALRHYVRQAQKINRYDAKGELKDDNN